MLPRFCHPGIDWIPDNDQVSEAAKHSNQSVFAVTRRGQSARQEVRQTRVRQDGKDSGCRG
jgi:hypothetical protein